MAIARLLANWGQGRVGVRRILGEHISPSSTFQNSYPIDRGHSSHSPRGADRDVVSHQQVDLIFPHGNNQSSISDEKPTLYSFLGIKSLDWSSFAASQYNPSDRGRPREPDQIPRFFSLQHRTSFPRGPLISHRPHTDVKHPSSSATLQVRYPITQHHASHRTTVYTCSYSWFSIRLIKKLNSLHQYAQYVQHHYPLFSPPRNENRRAASKQKA